MFLIFYINSVLNENFTVVFFFSVSNQQQVFNISAKILEVTEKASSSN